MENFLIGMHGGFDSRKFDRDFRTGFFGIEACLFPDEQAVEELVGTARKNGFCFGVHYPLLRKNTPYRDPFLIAPDPEERRQAWRNFEYELAYAAEKGAAYLLTHFPKPVLVNRSLDLNYWRFAGDREWMYADKYPWEQLKENLTDMFGRLDGLSRQYGIRIVLENDAMAEVLTQSSLLPDLFSKYDTIRVCLDIGRLHLQEKLDPAFHALDFTVIFAPFTYLIHLWNTNPVWNLNGGHYPVLPEQNSSEGWADVRGFLEVIKRHNSAVKVLFEHRSDLVSDAELEQCYNWVGRLLNHSRR